MDEPTPQRCGPWIAVVILLEKIIMFFNMAITDLEPLQDLTSTQDF